MAFKKPILTTAVPDSPDMFFLDLPHRKHPSLYAHHWKARNEAMGSIFKCR